MCLLTTIQSAATPPQLFCIDQKEERGDPSFIGNVFTRHFFFSFFAFVVGRYLVSVFTRQIKGCLGSHWAKKKENEISIAQARGPHRKINESSRDQNL